MVMMMIIYMMVITLAGFVDGTPVFCIDVKVMTAMVITQLMITITQIVVYTFSHLYI